MSHTDVERIVEEPEVVVAPPESGITDEDIRALSDGAAPETAKSEVVALPADQHTARPPEQQAFAEGRAPVSAADLSDKEVSYAYSKEDRAVGATALHADVVPAPIHLTTISTVAEAGDKKEPRPEDAVRDAQAPEAADEPPRPADGAGDDGGDGGDESGETSDEDDERRQPLPGKKAVMEALDSIGEPHAFLADVSVYNDPNMDEPDRISEVNEQVCGRLMWATEGATTPQEKAVTQVGLAVLEEAVMVTHERRGYQISPWETPPQAYTRRPPLVGEVKEEVEAIYARSNEQPPEEERRALDDPEVVAKLDAVRQASIEADGARVRYARDNSPENHLLYYGSALRDLHNKIDELDVKTLDFSRGNLPPDMEAPVRLTYGEQKAREAHDPASDHPMRWNERTTIAWNEFGNEVGLTHRKNELVSQPTPGTFIVGDHESVVRQALTPPYAPSQVQHLFKQAIRETFAAAGYSRSTDSIDPAANPLPNFQDVKATYLRLADEHLERLREHTPDLMFRTLRQGYEAFIDDAGSQL